MTADHPPLVIRFGRLGDLVLTWPAMAYLAEQQGGVEVVTARQYAPWLGELPWIARTWSLEPGRADLPDVLALASRIRERGHGPVIDLHASLRSRALSLALGGARQRVDKGSLARRLRLGLGPSGHRLRLAGGEVRGFPRRFLDAVGAPVAADALPGVPPALLGATPGDGGPRLALLPGARRGTKRWPAERFGELAAGWRRATGGESILFHGPGEEDLARAVLDRADGAARRSDDLELWAGTRGLSGCAVAVGGDTGLLHLAAAAGARPVGLFGPTGVDMGYWPWNDRGVAIAPDLPCHPCTLYGSAVCPLEHHRCMADLDVDRVLGGALGMLEAGP